MSTTTSSDTAERAAAGLIAEALREAASLARRDERWHCAALHGVEVADVHAALLRLSGGGPRLTAGPVDLGTVACGSGGDVRLLVPYLVGERGENSGEEGFAAWLRDEYGSLAATAEAHAPRILLVLSQTGIDTVLSASSDAAGFDGLKQAALAKRACGSGPASSLLGSAVDLAVSRKALPPGAAPLAAIQDLRYAPDVEAAGAGLYRLGCFLADPQAASDPARRLPDSLEWRVRLARWSSPDIDLAAELRNWSGDNDEPAVEAILARQTPFGLDFSGLPLSLMPARAEAGPSFTSPVMVEGARSVLSGGGSAAVWLPGGGVIALRLEGRLTDRTPSAVRWSDGTRSDATVDAERRIVAVPVESGGWRTAAVNVGGAIARITVYTEDGSWFPVERRMHIDVDEGGFAGDTPDVVAVGDANVPLGEAELSYSTDGWQAAFRGEAHPVPLAVPLDGDWDGLGPEEDDEKDDGDDGDGGLSGAAQPTVAHAALRAARELRSDSVSSLGYGDGLVTVDGATWELADQTLPGRIDGLALESFILSHPEWLAYALPAPGGRVSRDLRLERLRLDGLDQAALRAFLDARAALFNALAPSGSTQALSAGVARLPAEEYVAMYARLLDTVDASGDFQPEYERLLLCDAVSVPETGELLVAPTNPLSVAFQLAMTDALLVWVPRAAEVLDDDLLSVNPRHLVPVLAAGDAWYESVPAGPLLWRRYRPAPAGGVRPQHDHRHVARRLNHFMAVYPVYADERQELTVTFVEPGDGRVVREALRAFYRGHEQGPAEEGARPRLHVRLVTSERGRPAELDRLLAGQPQADGVSRGRDLDLYIRTRIRVTVLPPGHENPFSHVTFVFRSDLRRDPAAVNMDERAPTTWVQGIGTAPARLSRAGRNQTSFSWGTFAAPAPSGDSSSAALLALTRRCLEIVGGMPRTLMSPGVTQMPTTRVDAEFMSDVYGSSVWVVHLDQLLGLEAFAAAAQGERPRYVVHREEPDPGNPGLDAITATERVGPYRHAVTRALSTTAAAPDTSMDGFLRLLNAISGRWALDLVRAGTANIAERLGTVTAVAACDQLDTALGLTEASGTPALGLLVPLDELFDLLPRRGRPRPVGRSCDDLLHVHIPLDARGRLHLGGRLIEVKYRTTGAPPAAEARGELNRTLDWLDSVFNDEGPGRLFRARDLAELLRASAGRAASFGLGRPAPAADVERALRAVGAGEYFLDLSYRVGTTVLHGDVVSVENESAAPPVRRRLPGEGRAFGYVRLGRPALTAVGSGQPISAPDWQPVRFNMRLEDASGTAAADQETTETTGWGGGLPAGGTNAPESTPDARRPTTAADGRQPGFTPNAEAHAEVARVAEEMDAAAVKYGLSLEPFQPARAQVGPSVIRLRTRLLGKQTLAGVQSRALDLGREVGVAEGVLVDQEPYYLTVDVPRQTAEIVRFTDYLPALGSATSELGALPFLVGVAPGGEVRVADLARLPHLLVAGATNSGKSVLLRSLLCSLVHTRTPMDLSLLIIDPKQVDFQPFEELMHLHEGRIVTDPREAVDVLSDTLERELDRRRALLKDRGVFNALDFYAAGGQPHELQQMVVLVDEFADLADSLSGDERTDFMRNVKRYAQMTRALGIYLVLATQRPSVKVVTGDIKANLTARIALRMSSAVDSTTVLGRGGAESLRSGGDLLFDHDGRAERLQGFYCSGEDALAAVDLWRADR